MLTTDFIGGQAVPSREAEERLEVAIKAEARAKRIAVREAKAAERALAKAAAELKRYQEAERRRQPEAERQTAKQSTQGPKGLRSTKRRARCLVRFEVARVMCAKKGALADLMALGIQGYMDGRYRLENIQPKQSWLRRETFLDSEVSRELEDIASEHGAKVYQVASCLVNQAAYDYFPSLTKAAQDRAHRLEVEARRAARQNRQNRQNRQKGENNDD